MNEQQRAQGTAIVDVLRQAQGLIPIPHVVPAPGAVPSSRRDREINGTLEAFERYLYQREYELAWGILAGIATREQPVPRCWELLADAAMMIRTHERYDSYFMEHEVRSHANASTALDEAIQSLPSRHVTPPESVDARALVQRLAAVRGTD